MAGIRKKGAGYHRTFRFQRRRYYVAIGNIPEAQAKAKAKGGEDTLAFVAPNPGP